MKKIGFGCHIWTSCLSVHVPNWLPACLACIKKKQKQKKNPVRLETWYNQKQQFPLSLCLCPCVGVTVPPSVYLCVCRVHLCVAVQKMAEAHMQNLGVYPPLEDPCEGEEDEEGEEASPAKAAGETEAL